METGQKLKAAPWGGYDFAPDGTLVITKDQGIRLWNVDEGKLIGTLDDEPHEIGAVAFSSDGKLMAHGRRIRERRGGSLGSAKHRVIRVLRGARGGATVLAFSHDGGELYAGTGSSLIVGWDLHAEPAVNKVKPAEVRPGDEKKATKQAPVMNGDKESGATCLAKGRPNRRTVSRLGALVEHTDCNWPQRQLAEVGQTSAANSALQLA